MESLRENDSALDQLALGADRTGADDTELPYLSRGDHRDAELPDADNPIWGDHVGAAGDRFTPGVHDPDNLFDARETAAAEKLAEDGAMVSALNVDAPLFGHVEGLALVRTSQTDTGTPTAFTSLEAGSPEAVADALDQAAGRIGDVGKGDVVLDGRQAGLTLEGARAGWELAGNADREMPERLHCVLADGEVHTFPES